MAPDDDGPPGDGHSTLPARRTVGAVAIGAATVMWWPAFTLGVWGEVFFEQVLTLWAAATASLVLLTVRAGGHGIRRPLAASLALPSLWVLLEFLPTEPGTPLDVVITWFGVTLTIVGLPAMAWVILRMTRPELIHTMPTRAWVAAGATVAAVATLSVLLGWLHPYYLTCDDFSVSGNSQPPGCTPGNAG